MAKRGYKLQEFVAHSGAVNCVTIGKKRLRHFVTGGDDYKVNLWAIGNPNSLMSLCGHTSPVESVAFDAAEVLVLAGDSTGVIKLWDLEEVKMVRTLNGHKSYCTAVEFHPFGEFVASGSMDTNLKIWDIRKKGCIQTYNGHTRGISTVKFTPDGRWVVSGGLDNVVTVWDLTAGKLLNEFKFHDGHIRSIDFHPIEFLLATGSADRTVKFWDLETFELVGSSRPEGKGVRAVKFHPDGKSLFCGLDDSLKVYSWEPVICHDAVDMGWSTLGDLSIHDGKLLGCSYFHNSVGVWVADFSLIEPYGVGIEPKQNVYSKQSLKCGGSHPSESGFIFTSRMHPVSPDSATNDIKNIYVDTAGRKPVASPPKAMLPLDFKKTPSLSMQKRSVSQRESITSKINSDRLLKPGHSRSVSVDIYDSERLLASNESEIDKNLLNDLDNETEPNCHTRREAKEKSGKSCERKLPSVKSVPSIKSVAEKFEKILSPQTRSNQETYNSPQKSVKEGSLVKFVNGVKLVRGRTRSLVDLFERGELQNKEEETATNFSCNTVPKNEASKVMPEALKGSTLVPETDKASIVVPETDEASSIVPETDNVSNMDLETDKASGGSSATYKSCSMHPAVVDVDRPYAILPSAESRPNTIPTVNIRSAMIPERGRNSSVTPVSDKNIAVIQAVDDTSFVTRELDNTSITQSGQPQISGRELTSTDDGKMFEDLLEIHDVFLSSLRSRLTKLQVARHFWERNDIKGAINTMKKLPDHAVQVDVLSILMEKMEILTLDLCSSLLPILVGLLDSKTERHVKISLEMLLKLVALFGPVIHSTVSAPRLIGVDLHAEQRLECCKQCFTQLQKIQNMLPLVARRGGLLAKSACEFNLVLQQL